MSEAEQEILKNNYLMKEVFRKEGMCEHGNRDCQFCNAKKKVLVALSGGVDSSVAALLLKQQGFDVVGAYMKLNNCIDESAQKSARAVAKKLDIPFYVFDVSKEFSKEVVNYFLNTYASGKTPNPCVVCNKTIKFGWLLERAKKLGCDYLATGHYAQLCREIRNLKFEIRNQPQIPNTRYQILLKKAKDSKKDQSYFLWQLDQKQLRYIIFPLADLGKEEVRNIAKDNKLPTYNKKESQDICFIKDNDTKKYLQKNIDLSSQKEGKVVDVKGNVLGKHKGLAYYNVGQRESLPLINYKKYHKFLNPQQLPAIYVVKLDKDQNELVVGVRSELAKKIIYAKYQNWLDSEMIKFPLKCQAKIRYGAKAEDCNVNNSQDGLRIDFINSQYAVTPGQSIVFYKKDILLGGAIIQ